MHPPQRYKGKHAHFQQFQTGECSLVTEQCTYLATAFAPVLASLLSVSCLIHESRHCRGELAKRMHPAWAATVADWVSHRLSLALRGSLKEAEVSHHAC